MNPGHCLIERGGDVQRVTLEEIEYGSLAFGARDAREGMKAAEKRRPVCAGE